jgi:hypothetical protein
MAGQDAGKKDALSREGAGGPSGVASIQLNKEVHWQLKLR